MNSQAAAQDRAPVAEPRVVTGGETLWFLGTLARMKLDGQQTAGRFALGKACFPTEPRPRFIPTPKTRPSTCSTGKSPLGSSSRSSPATTLILQAGPEPVGADAAWEMSYSRPGEPRTPSAWNPTPRGCWSCPRRPGSRAWFAVSQSLRIGRGCSHPPTDHASQPSGWLLSSMRPAWSDTDHLHRRRTERNAVDKQRVNLRSWQVQLGFTQGMARGWSAVDRLPRPTSSDFARRQDRWRG
jgi:hypothetical protein